MHRALTVHKAQGLTLRRVTYDAGLQEPDFAVGITFVALTRVRHPGHIVFSPFVCSAERLTSGIALKPSLYHRKLHEWELRKCARATARKWRHLDPPESATAPLPPKPQKSTQERTQSIPNTAAGPSKTVSNIHLWSPPTNTQQQVQQIMQRRDGASSIAPAANVDVRMVEVNEPHEEIGTAKMYDDVCMHGEDEPQAARWDEECAIDSDEEQMADDMLADADAW